MIPGILNRRKKGGNQCFRPFFSFCFCGLRDGTFIVGRAGMGGKLNIQVLPISSLTFASKYTKDFDRWPINYIPVSCCG